MIKTRVKSTEELMREIKKAQKDPNFIKEINRFIKASMKVHKLK